MGHCRNQTIISPLSALGFLINRSAEFCHLKSKARQAIFAEDKRLGNLCSSCPLWRGFSLPFRGCHLGLQVHVIQQHILHRGKNNDCCAHLNCTVCSKRFLELHGEIFPSNPKLRHHQNQQVFLTGVNKGYFLPPGLEMPLTHLFWQHLQ